jgi:hypothetical protein
VTDTTDGNRVVRSQHGRIHRRSHTAILLRADTMSLVIPSRYVAFVALVGASYDLLLSIHFIGDEAE